MDSNLKKGSMSNWNIKANNNKKEVQPYQYIQKNQDNRDRMNSCNNKEPNQAM